MTELLLVLQYIGSLYAPWAPSEVYYEVALAALHVPHMLRSPFNVQALMLFAIAQHHQCLKAESRVTMNMAVGIALGLGMSEKGFAQAYGEDNPVLEECWRRTWYCLQVYEQFFSVAENTPLYILSNIPGTVDLPCDDEFFESGVSCTMSFVFWNQLTGLDYTPASDLAGVREPGIRRRRGHIFFNCVLVRHQQNRLVW
jgi:hypothetical protein